MGRLLCHHQRMRQFHHLLMHHFHLLQRLLRHHQQALQSHLQLMLPLEAADPIVAPTTTGNAMSMDGVVPTNLDAKESAAPNGLKPDRAMAASQDGANVPTMKVAVALLPPAKV